MFIIYNRSEYLFWWFENKPVEKYPSADEAVMCIEYALKYVWSNIIKLMVCFCPFLCNIYMKYFYGKDKIRVNEKYIWRLQ